MLLISLLSIILQCCLISDIIFSLPSSFRSMIVIASLRLQLSAHLILYIAVFPMLSAFSDIVAGFASRRLLLSGILTVYLLISGICFFSVYVNYISCYLVVSNFTYLFCNFSRLTRRVLLLLLLCTCFLLVRFTSRPILFPIISETA